MKYIEYSLVPYFSLFSRMRDSLIICHNVLGNSHYLHYLRLLLNSGYLTLIDPSLNEEALGSHHIHYRLLLFICMDGFRMSNTSNYVCNAFQIIHISLNFIHWLITDVWRGTAIGLELFCSHIGVDGAIFLILLCLLNFIF